jgi:hypothetical protein
LGGYSVTLTGNNFAPGAVVTFGGTQATVTSVSSTQMIVLVPPGSGTVSVVVGVSGQTSNSLPFTYLPPTPTPTITDTPTATATPTSTPPNLAVIYPNPSDGTVPARIQIPIRAVTDVKVKVYTTGFRKIQQLDFYGLGPADSELTLPMSDKWGASLANGLYYVVVAMDQGVYRVKWLILR